MLRIPYETSEVIDSIGTTRPAAGMGGTVTPGNNTKGSYASVQSALASDAYGIKVSINSNFAVAAARDTIIDIAIDPAGGTSFSKIICPDLLGSCAGVLGSGISAQTGYVNYYFWLFIPAGASIGARASINNATVGTLRVKTQTLHRPKHAIAFPFGTYVDAYGIAGASSSGTAVTPGEAAEGDWVELGELSRPAWWFQLGFGISQGTMTAKMYFADLALGDASNKTIIIANELINTSTSEALCKEGVAFGCAREAPAGVKIYGRLQCSGTADAGISMAAYAMGG